MEKYRFHRTERTTAGDEGIEREQIRKTNVETYKKKKPSEIRKRLLIHDREAQKDRTHQGKRKEEEERGKTDGLKGR